MKKALSLLLSLSLLPALAGAAVKSELVEYRQGDTVLQGWLAYDDAAKGPRPGVLLVHDWLGVTEHQKGLVEKLAALGYVALAADIYGKGVRPADAKAASAESGRYYKDAALLRARARAGLDFLASRPQADAARLAATGYCFGGAGALELARSGAPLRAVVTFHGTLDALTGEPTKDLKASVLVLHGADDPYVKPEKVAAFVAEMRAANADWQLVQYSGAVHSFSDPRAGNDASKGAAYNPTAERRSWEAMKDFLAERLAK